MHVFELRQCGTSAILMAYLRRLKMELSLIQLAHAATDALAPAMPLLMPIAAVAGKEVVKSTATKITDATLQRAKTLWKKLWPEVQNKSAALEAAKNLAEMPEDDDAKAAFRFQLRKIFAADDVLAHDVTNLLVNSSVQVTASGERSVAAHTVTDSIITTGDQK
jgi:hypothetical protein